MKRSCFNIMVSFLYLFFFLCYNIRVYVHVHIMYTCQMLFDRLRNTIGFGSSRSAARGGRREKSDLSRWPPLGPPEFRRGSRSGGIRTDLRNDKNNVSRLSRGKIDFSRKRRRHDSGRTRERLRCAANVVRALTHKPVGRTDIWTCYKYYLWKRTLYTI